MGWSPRSSNLLSKGQMQGQRKYVLLTELTVYREAGKNIKACPKQVMSLVFSHSLYGVNVGIRIIL